jgi:hypothetical protein
MIETTGDVPEYFDRSEVHGILCGMLCVSEVECNAWLRQIINELPDGHRLGRETRDTLLDIYRRTVLELADDDFGFFPLLPSDNAPLSERTESLGSWCRGLVFGLGLGGFDERRMTAEIKEFMNDIIAISRVGSDTDQVSEEDERAYAEIVEYIRVGVMLIYRTLRPPVPQSGPH